MKILEKGVNKNTERRLGLKETSVVFTNMLIESTCCSDLCAVCHELGEVHRRRLVTIESHSRSNQDKLDREVAKIKLQLEMMRELLQKDEEGQGYKWTL